MHSTLDAPALGAFAGNLPLLYFCDVWQVAQNARALGRKH